ncbi:hypothetical protein COTS27_00921 [Spirochaetota bacterium]|nr:hypothetical protein COTS27_00921 [Spirochaetota bacterium]
MHINKIIIRTAINIKVLFVTLVVIVGILGGGLFIIYLSDFNKKLSSVETMIAAGDWEATETALTELREYRWFNKRILVLQLNYLRAKNLEKPVDYELMEMLRIANYMQAHYRSYKKTAEEILGEVYYQLGVAYYEQALEYLERVSTRLDKEAHDNTEALSLYKKLYAVCEHLNRLDKMLYYTHKVLKLEPNNYEFQINLAKVYLHQKDYETVLVTLEQVLFNDDKDFIAIQKSGMMLYALMKYLHLDDKANFYLEYINAKHDQLLLAANTTTSAFNNGINRNKQNLTDTTSLSSTSKRPTAVYNSAIKESFEIIEKTTSDNIIEVFNGIEDLKWEQPSYLES